MTARIDFARNAEAALQDVFLQGALRTAMTRFRDLRRSVVAEISDWEVLRAHAYAVKMHVLANLAGYLEQLEGNVAAAGGTVHWAADATQARRVIADLARSKGIRTVVKSKSMTTEELELTPALEAIGLQVLESDFGEYVIQLAGERPAHIIAPAIHKSKTAIATLLAEKLGVPVYEEPERLTHVVREALRERFLAAEMGISGVNFAIAETGTVVVVENEGNARLTTTLPPIHVAVMGIEKVLPRIEDLAVFLTLLARSATGQRMSSYVSLITGPRRGAEVDGPEEFHLVLVDNGRSSIQADPAMREVLACIRCGACLNVCPVFERTGGHAYGSPYSGPIGAVITPLLVGLDAAGDLPFASSLCGACGEVCPVKIDLPRLLLELRARVIAVRRAPWVERFFIWGWVATMAKVGRLRWVGKLLRRIQPLLGRRHVPLPYPFSQWTKMRDFPAPVGASFRERWRP